MCNCPYCLSDVCRGTCTPAHSGFSMPWVDSVTGTFDVPMDAACDCPADNYLTVIRVIASEIDALEREADAVRDLLSQLLDHVRWDSIPESLCHAIDAELDGNTEDESE